MERDEALRLLESVVARSGDERVARALETIASATARAWTIGEITSALLRGDGTYRLVFSHERDAMSLFEAETGRIVEVNDAWIALYGFARDEALRMRVMDVSAEPDRTWDAIGRARVEGGTRLPLRWHKKKDGTVFPVELTSDKLEIGGRVLMYAAMRDIGERVRAEGALARSEASFRALIESMVDGVVVHRDGKLVYMNPAGRTLLGYGPDEDVTGTPVIQLFHPDDRDHGADRLRRLYGGESLPFLEERFLRRDGKILLAEVSAMPTVFDGEPAIIAIGRDASVRKRMEAQLMMADRLASIGRLAASVGHELNNPLAYVLGTVSLLERDVAGAELPPDVAARMVERLGILREGAERMRDIVRDLKTLARADDEAPGPVDVARVLDVCADMAAHEVRHRARLVKDYASGLFALGSEARLGQVFLNLIVNAAQAIPDGDADGNEVRIAARVEDDQIVVEVRDTGVGIREEDLPHVFDPFFTTKAPGAGTGLGLSICHHIVSSLGGTIGLSRLEPRGTCFRVALPPADAEPHVTRSSTPRPPPRRTRVLVVDDEPRVAEVCAAELDGYDVTIAHGGREAIELIDDDPGFDAVVCDLLMADRSGVDVYEHIREAHPGAERRVVFMTGGAPTRGAQELLERIPNPCLEKPFGGDALRSAVRRAAGV